MNIPPISKIQKNKNLKRINTIGSTLVFYDPRNGIIYKSHIKPGINGNSYSINFDKNLEEFESLNNLYSLGINVPKTLGIGKDSSILVMEYKKGETLDYFLINNEYSDDLFINLGKNIYELHNNLKNKPLSAFLKDADPYLNSQCALNFNKLTIKWLKSSQVNLDKKGKLTFEIFRKNIAKAKTVLRNNQNYLVCNAISYGDLKPDNIIIGKDYNLFFIDPIICKSRTSCDLGKLLSRLILLNPFLHANKCKLIIKSYYKNKIPYKLIEEIEFMIAVDMLNIYSRNLSINSRMLPAYYLQMQKNYYYCFKNIVPKLLDQEVFLKI